MNNTISFTIPVTVSAMTRMSEMLQGMIADQDGAPCDGPSITKALKVEAAIKEKKQIEVATHNSGVTQGTTTGPVVDTPAANDAAAIAAEMDRYDLTQGATIEQITQAEVNAGTLAGTTAEAAFTAATVDISGAVEVGKPVVTAATSAAAGIELDSEGLPWDGRIHPASKLKLSKSQAWKKIRNVDAALVATVESELRQALAVGAAAGPGAEAVVNHANTNTGPVVNTVATTQTQGPVVDLVVVPSAPPINTFPEFLQATTSAGKTPVEVAAACAQVGLSGTPMLALAPQQIPAVLAALGL